MPYIPPIVILFVLIGLYRFGMWASAEIRRWWNS
jgi:hypothetical protein